MNMFHVGEPIINGTIFPYIEYPKGYYLFVLEPINFMILILVLINIKIIIDIIKDRRNKQ